MKTSYLVFLVTRCPSLVVFHGLSWALQLTPFVYSFTFFPFLLQTGDGPSGLVTQVYMDKMLDSRMHFWAVVINAANLLEPSGKALHIILQYSPEQILSVPREKGD